MQALARNVGILSRNNGALASMLSLLNAGEMPSEPKELRILLQDTGHLARETGELLLRLQQECALNEAGSGREQVALGKLSRDFQLVLRRFQQLAEDSAQHAKNDEAHGGGGGSCGGGSGMGIGAGTPPSHPPPQPPSYGGGGRSAATLDYGDDDDDDFDDDFDDNGAEQRGLLGSERQRRQQQQQQQQQRRRHQAAQNTADAMAEREKIITQVESTVGEVREIFTDLASLVSEQADSINHISSAIENTATQAGRAADELKVASRYKGQLRSRKCCLYGVALLTAFLLFLIVSKSLG